MVAGFDTTASTLTSSCFELARHPEIQEKLYDQIMDKIDKYVRSTNAILICSFKW